nr:MAG TPA: hypothetical protein [Caudoviricetes sp.]
MRIDHLLSTIKQNTIDYHIKTKKPEQPFASCLFSQFKFFTCQK